MSAPATPPLEVRRISTEETIALRWPILRAGLPRETSYFAGDDAADSAHFGCYAAARLLGVATLHTVRLASQQDLPAVQLRGMAVREEARGTGVGRLLLQAAETWARAQGAQLLWCNARTPAVEFYRRHGLQTVGAEFEIPTAGPHYLMFRRL